MRRLTRYLARLFAVDALILFAVVCGLLWMVNCLRSFDVVSVKGQGVLTLAYQGLLTMPPLALVFFYVCVGIGMARALQALKTNHELHIIHTTDGLRSLFGATATVATIGVLCVLVLSNFLDPWATRGLNQLTASVAADLVSSTLKPKRFTQVTPGVVLLIGGRSGEGEITEFFADDRRDPAVRRTYIAKSARISSDGKNYVLELHDGTLQYSEQVGRFSEISFARYDLSVDQLSQPLAQPDPLAERDSLQLVSDALASGDWPEPVVDRLLKRMNEALSVIGICMLVLALSGFPSGRRGGRIAVPMEVAVLLLAFAERGVSSYSPLGPATGALLMMGAAAIIIFVRARPRRIQYAVMA
ncbi:MAG: LptF/LptG family permease [Devosia sp.]|uniref:LptF/LptG family permease n=1 Tax=Devosia sp. TaxID=1871048 RepID=UPI0026064282|nr:LptF/LptG family permease [Devosia sp.]MDB5535556.1 LptF/LptG family permease [Devosia sp.]MDB5587419.1 LptF/LptG family permease [Devosia sp.]